MNWNRRSQPRRPILGVVVGKGGDRSALTAGKDRHPNKYRAKKQVVDGIIFDSMREAKRYGELRLQERAGLITRLQCHVKFPMKIDGKLICTYIADFWYFEGPRSVVEDVKSKPTKTSTYSIKRKLFLALYPGIEHHEIF